MNDRMKFLVEAASFSAAIKDTAVIQTQLADLLGASHPGLNHEIHRLPFMNAVYFLAVFRLEVWIVGSPLRFLLISGG